MQGYDEVIAGFLRQISEADARASALKAANGGREIQHDGHVQPVFAELDVALEELHTAEEELRAQNEELIAGKERLDAERQRYLELFRDAPVAYLVSDMAGVIQEANRAACNLLHRPERFLRGKPIAIFAPEGERGALRDIIHDLNHLQVARQRLEIILSPSGSRPFTAQVIASRVSAPSGASSTIRWTLVDRPESDERGPGISERMVVKALQESDDEAIIALDQDDRVTWWNHGAELAFGYSSAEVLGQPSPVRPLGRSDQEEIIERKDGRKIRLEVSRLPLPTGGAEGYLFRMRRARAERRQHREANGDRAVSRLAGGMAHHLNNVMQIVVSGLEFARRDISDADQLSKDLQTVKDAAFRAVAFTRALVSYAGEDLVSPSSVNLNTLIETAVAEATRQFPETTYATFLDRGIPEIYVDAEAMSRVIRELLVNGARSLETGGKILVETLDVPAQHEHLRREMGAPHGYVRMSVHDNGSGMDEGTRMHLFEPFFAIRPTGNPVGLGLSAAWGVVMKSGGFIRVETKPGSGSSFHVYLPKATSTSSPRPMAETPIRTLGLTDS